MLDVLVGVNDVALSLRHFRAFADDVTVRAKAREGLLEIELPRVVQNHRDESRIQEMQHRVLVTSDVRRNGQPLPGDILLEWHVVAADARISEEIPGAVQK